MLSLLFSILQSQVKKFMICVSPCAADTLSIFGRAGRMVFNRHCLWRLNPAGTSALLRWTKRSYGRVCRGGLGFSVLWLIVAAGLPSLKDAMADPTQVPAATQETDVPEVNLSGDTSAQWAIVIVALASFFLTAYFLIVF